jgi:hypothetical protein
MSAGVFESSRYELSAENGGGIAPCKVQPETLAATIDGVANDAPTGAVTIPNSANMVGPRNANGIQSRYVTLEWTGAPPTGYSGDNVRIPVLQPSTYAAWTKDATGTYLGAGVKVVGRIPERVN